jgi:nucleoside phosphorylase/ADP-ribose pyrophosphatase YjhB (NUDIX family)
VAYDDWQPPQILMTVDLVILTLRAASLQVLLVQRGVQPYAGMAALPGGFLNNVDEGLETAARRELAEEAGLRTDALYLEQFGVYGDPGRDPRGRIVSAGYLAITPRLPDPTAGTDAAGAWWAPVQQVLGGEVQLAFDHRRILADGIERARSKLEYSTIATAFCERAFTLSELQQVYEAVWGVPLDPRNFYRKVRSSTGFVVPAGPARKNGTGRPARLYRAGPRKVLRPPIVRSADSQSEQEQAMDDEPIRENCVVILTALDLEYEAVRAKLSGIQEWTHASGTRFEVGYLGDQRQQVVLGQVGVGNHPAAVLTERAITEFKPVAVLFVGVAGALWPQIALGDIVVATRVYAYHGATSEIDGLKARPRAWEIPHRADQIARHLVRSKRWQQYLPVGSQVPAVRFAPIAAGEIVHYSTSSDPFQWIRQHYNDAVAVEMEAAGAAQAGHLNGATPVVVVRAISDRADGNKAAADDAGWQPRAAANAAAFATALAEELVKVAAGPAKSSRSVEREKEEHAAYSGHELAGLVRTSGGTTTNIATGNARVGAQAGQIFGDVHAGAAALTPTGLDEQLADLREHIRRAYRAGDLDRETHEAAQAELDTAATLAGDPEEASGRLVVVLKRLRGLISDVADLGAKVATILATVRGL